MNVDAVLRFFFWLSSVLQNTSAVQEWVYSTAAINSSQRLVLLVPRFSKRARFDPVKSIQNLQRLKIEIPRFRHMHAFGFSD
jgi:hypothetical protein